MAADFFDEPLEQSLVKSRIVSNYFASWAWVMTHTPRHSGNGNIGFFDLYAGTGSYKDGSKSTPLLVLDKAIANPDLHDKLITMFNDGDETCCNQLRTAIAAFPGIDRLKHKPKLSHYEVNSDIADFFRPKNLIPSILFLDPWGYKGVTLELIRSVIKDWGCECIFFFNYRRVNAAFDNPQFSDHVDALFGVDRSKAIRTALHGKSPFDRENFILDQLVEALLSQSAQYVLKFRFISPTVDRTSHYLIFVTKGFRGYEIMKDIMAGESVPKNAEVPTFEFTENPNVHLEFTLEQPHEELATTLLAKNFGQTLAFSDIYEQCSPGTNFVKRNFRSALTILEQRGKLTAQNEGPTKRRAGTFGDKCRITFKEYP